MNANDVRDIFPQRLKEAMKKRNLTPGQMGYKLGIVPNDTLYNYLNGKALPKAPRLAELAQILHVSTDWLLGLTDEVMR